jgi:hypothetical protein
MNPIFSIILGIIICVLLYLVYQYFFSKTTTLSSKVYLGSNPPPISTIVNPQSANFSFVVWIYVNTWSGGNIFRCGSSDFSLDLDAATPALSCSINTGQSACIPNANPMRTTITTNTHIQRWFQCIVSVNGSIMDIYLDGKLVKSVQLNGIPTLLCPSKNWAISFGSGDIYLSNFQRITSATDPATAMSLYRSNQPSSTTTFSTYGGKLQLAVNGVDQTPIKLF